MRDLEARYYGYVSYIDAQIGRVLQALDASGQAANTLVLFTTDHGEMIGSHGLIYKGAHLYEEMVRVPLLLRLPGRIPAGKTVDALAGQVDLLPTVLSTLGVGVPTEVQGKDLTPLLQGRRREVRREVFCEFPAAGMKMVRTDRWKLVVNAGRRRDLDELYDLKNDPLELRNLIGAPEHAAVRKELTGRLVDWNRETGDPFHAVFLAQMQRTAEPMQEVTPRDVRIAHLGGGKFSLEYTWHVESAVADKYWSFVQFLSKRYGKDGEIAFRCVQWPPRETQTWKPGEEHPMGPFTVEVPANCGAGEYGVRIGLWNPDTKQGPNLARGQGNSVMAGRLLVEKKGEEIIAIRFDPKVPDTLPRRTR